MSAWANRSPPRLPAGPAGARRAGRCRSRAGRGHAAMFSRSIFRPSTEAAWSAALSFRSSRSTLAWMRLCTEPGTALSGPSSASRRSCSRRSGLPAARSTQRSARAAFEARNGRARRRASAASSGSRSMVSNWSPTTSAHHAWRSGSPSYREVVTRSARHRATAPASSARSSSVGRSAQCKSSTTKTRGRVLLAPSAKRAKARRLPLSRTELSIAS